MPDAAKIRVLNDAFRSGERPGLGRILLTSGVRELTAPWPLGVATLFSIVQRYDRFTNSNDPHGEHDFGAFEFAGEKCFWKIDYYNKTLEGGSGDPADPDQTTRVLTIMLASEY